MPTELMTLPASATAERLLDGDCPPGLDDLQAVLESRPATPELLMLPRDWALALILYVRRLEDERPPEPLAGWHRAKGEQRAGPYRIVREFKKYTLFYEGVALAHDNSAAMLRNVASVHWQQRRESAA